MTKVHIKYRLANLTQLKQLATMQEFVDSCSACKKNYPVENHVVDITLSKAIASFPSKNEIIVTDGLSFNISIADIARIINQLVRITQDPMLVARLLRDLDAELGLAMEREHLQFSEHDKPDYLIAGEGMFMPGPPPENYRPGKKAKLLDAVLPRRERVNRVNEEGFSPTFVGFVQTDAANPFVGAGHVFNDAKHIGRLLFHGSYTHRIMIDAIACAINMGLLDTFYGDGKILNLRQLIEILTLTKLYSNQNDMRVGRDPKNIWSVAIDNVADSKRGVIHHDQFKNPDHYTYSCRSPYVFHSIILCFGAQLHLPHLQHYLLDSHWKAVYRMLHKVKCAVPETKLHDHELYNYCQELLSFSGKDIQDIGSTLPYIILNKNAGNHTNYQPFDPEKPVAEIGRKVARKKEVGRYASWQAFLAYLDDTVSQHALTNFVNAYDLNIKEICLKIKSYDDLIEYLLELAQRNAVGVLKQLGSDRLVKLFPSTIELAAAIDKLGNASKYEVLIALLNEFENDPLDNLMLKKYKAVNVSSPWYGAYDRAALTRYLNVLRTEVFERTITCTVNLGSVKLAYEQGCWVLIYADGIKSVSMVSQHAKQIAARIFELLRRNNHSFITLYTQIKTPQQHDFFLKSYEEMEYLQLMNSLRVLNDYLSVNEFEKAKAELLCEAFKRHNYRQCHGLILHGVDLNCSNINGAALTEKTQIVLYNSLCEAQAKYYVEASRKKLFATDWRNKIIGNKICDNAKGLTNRVPSVVKAEWQQICLALTGDQSYLHTWNNILMLRQHAAHKNHRLRFFRSEVEKQHYQNPGVNTGVRPNQTAQF